MERKGLSVVNPDVFNALFLIAAVEWITITLLFTSRFALALTTKSGRVPFVVSQSIVGVLRGAQAVGYAMFLYWFTGNENWALVMLYSLPTVLIAEGVTFVVVNLWVFNRTIERQYSGNRCQTCGQYVERLAE